MKYLNKGTISKSELLKILVDDEFKTIISRFISNCSDEIEIEVLSETKVILKSVNDTTIHILVVIYNDNYPIDRVIKEDAKPIAAISYTLQDFEEYELSLEDGRSVDNANS